MQASKSANINWVKDIYIEQEYEVLNDSVFLMKRDYFLSDFSFQKKTKQEGYMVNVQPFTIIINLTNTKMKHFTNKMFLVLMHQLIIAMKHFGVKID